MTKICFIELYIKISNESCLFFFLIFSAYLNSAFFFKYLPTNWETLFSVRVFYFYGRYWCVQPQSTGTLYAISFVNNFPSRLYCTTSRLTKMKNHRKDYSYYSGCIAGDGDLFETLRPPGFNKRIVVPPFLALWCQPFVRWRIPSDGSFVNY